MGGLQVLEQGAQPLEPHIAAGAFDDSGVPKGIILGLQVVRKVCCSLLGYLAIGTLPSLLPRLKVRRQRPTPRRAGTKKRFPASDY